MMNECKAKITINKVDNGFILKWEHARRSGQEYFGDRGYEIFASKDDLMLRIHNLLAA